MSDQNLYITGTVRVLGAAIYHNGTQLPVAQAEQDDFLQSLYEKLDICYPKFFKMDALCKLGIAAAHVLLKDFATAQYAPEAVGIVLSNKGGSIEADINYFESSKTFPSPSLFVYTLPNIVIGEISIRYGFKGENAFFICEAFDPEWTHFYVSNLMHRQGIDMCICGWAEVVNGQYDARFFLVEKEKQNGVNFTVGALAENQC